MHLNQRNLMAYFDGEAAAGSRRIARHLSKCQRCCGELERLQRERTELAASVTTPEVGTRALPGLSPAIAGWRANSNGAAELRRRLRSQIECYFGSPALAVVERPGMPAEELLATAGEMLDVFLGQAAARAVQDDVLRGLGRTRSEAAR